MLIRPRKLIDYQEILLRRKRVFFLMFLVMLIAVYVIIRRIPNLYETRAMIVITNMSLGENVQQGPSYSSLIAYLTSRGNLASLIQRHKLYPHIKDKSMDAAVGIFRKEIKLDIKMRGYHPDAPESVTITFRYPDPNIAQKVMNDLVANFEQANQKTRQQALNEVNEMNMTISEVESRLRRIAPRQDLELIRAQEVTRAFGDATAVRLQRQTIEGSVNSLNDKEYQLQRQLADLQQQITEQEKSISNAPLPDNPALGPLLVRKSELEAQLKVQLTQYTEKNPKIITSREQLVEVNRQISRLAAASVGNNNLTALSPAVLDLNKMRLELRRLETDLEITRRDLNRKSQSLATLQNSSDGDLAISTRAPSGLSVESRAEYDRLLTRYNLLSSRQDMLMKVAGIAGSEMPMFQILDNANRGELPVAPNRQMLYIVALAIAVVFGFLVVAAFELPRVFLLNDERDIQYYLGAPVVALIPETFTPIERSRYRRVRMTQVLISLLLGAGLIPILFLMISRLGIFQFLGNK